MRTPSRPWPVFVIALALGASGCASAPRVYPVLEDARAIVATAQADPRVAQYAAADLDRAVQALAAADAAVAQRAGEEVEHHAYVAAQNARTAQAIAEGKAAEARIAQAEGERTRIRLEAREREAAQARQVAAAATARAATAEDEVRRAREAQAQFEREIAALQATRNERGAVVTLRDVLFATGRAELQPGADRPLDYLARALQDAPDRRVLIEGFTDSTGSDALNLRLSDARAEAVRAALIRRGVNPTQLETRGYGAAFPVADNATPAGRQLNRRVELIIADPGKTIPTRR